MKADTIEMDKDNGDGVFKARNKTTKKWGMYQWRFDDLKTKMLIPMQYDSLDYFPYNANFTAVYNNDKIGFYLSAWVYNEAKQTVPCLYDDYHRYIVTKDRSERTYLAVKKNGKWGWVNWLTGEEKTAFIYDIKEDLPYPNFVQEYR
ncbi:hypothetical protein [Lutibacter sp.]